MTPPVPWFVHATNASLLVCLGLSLEVVFTAVLDHPKSGDWKLKGYTYVWMIPIYALIYPGLCLLYPHLASQGFLLRGVSYAALIYFFEYLSGWLLRRLTGECPWESEYRGKKWAVHDLIRLDFFPAWFGASLLYELVFRVLRGRF